MNIGLQDSDSDYAVSEDSMRKGGEHDVTTALGGVRVLARSTGLYP